MRCCNGHLFLPAPARERGPRCSAAQHPPSALGPGTCHPAVPLAPERTPWNGLCSPHPQEHHDRGAADPHLSPAGAGQQRNSRGARVPGDQDEAEITEETVTHLVLRDSWTNGAGEEDKSAPTCWCLRPPTRTPARRLLPSPAKPLLKLASHHEK